MMLAFALENCPGSSSFRGRLSPLLVTAAAANAVQNLS
jgi:hypothetical protein